MSLCFMLSSWTNQIPSSTVSALSVQLWLTGPVWSGVRGAGTLIGLGERLMAQGPGEEVGPEMPCCGGPCADGEKALWKGKQAPRSPHTFHPTKENAGF